MSDAILQTYVVIRCLAITAERRLRQDQRGEGVISAAIAADL